MTNAQFTCERFGSEYRVELTIGNVCRRPYLQAWFSFRNGFGGGGRRVVIGFLDEDIDRVAAGMSGEMPRWAFADVLQELGADEGVVATIRGT